MCEEIRKNLYRVKVPLPFIADVHLNSLNAYVIKGGERNLIVDTGMNLELCRRALEEGLRQIGIDLRNTDFFITHYHLDHLDLGVRLAGKNSRIYLSKADAEKVASLSLQKNVIDASFARQVGFPDEDLQKVTRSHPGNRYRSCADSIHFYFLKDGDRLNVGDYEFVCVSTPGHTKGHLCLHESKEKVLLAGDHILKDITPTIQLWNDRDNPLGEYYNSLRKVDLLDIGLVLPGHRDVFDHVTERIREIRSLHLQRSEEILMVLAKKRETAYQLASEVQWNSDGETWSSFPEFHRWLATGEVLAHLRFLEEKGRVRKIRKSRPVLFEKTLSSNF